jgi:uncharacterized protein (DUF302 family)
MPVGLAIPILATSLALAPMASVLAQESACSGVQAPFEPGLTTLQSAHPIEETISRFEVAVKERSWTVLATIDHSAAAAAVGLQLRPRTVIFFGNPRSGTSMMQRSPTLAIDLPLRALVWQDDDGRVWLTYNSVDFLASEICARHRVSLSPEARGKIDSLLTELAQKATE